MTLIINDHPNDLGKDGLTALNSNSLPIYDVYLVIRSHVDMPMDTPEQQQKALPFLLNPDKYETGNIPKYGAKDTGVFLEPGYHQIDARTRYVKFIEMMKFGPFNSVLRTSISVTNFQEKVLHQFTSPEGYTKIY